MPDEEKYIMPCLLQPPIARYQRELVDLIAARLGLTFTQRQAIPAHFTLKYHFTTATIEQVEDLVGEFARGREPAPVVVGGFGHFLEDVVFVEVGLSAAARRLLEALLVALRTLPWMSWHDHDAEHLHPHMTIAEHCRARFGEVWELLRSHERQLGGSFDNVTILRKVGERDGMDRWAVHRTFALGG